MLTLILNITMPKVIGVAKSIDVVENLYLSKILKIKLDKPTEKIIENKYEYPIK